MVTSVRPRDWDPSHRAPGQLELVRQFANTVDLYRGDDLLADVDQAALTLKSLGLLAEGEPFGDAELEQTRGFRTAMRSVFVDDEHSPRSGIPALEFRVIFDGVGRVETETTSTGLWGQLSDLSVEVWLAGRTGELSRLKACANPGCRWLFWDPSRPGTGRWCSMQVCGGQQKARNYRARKRQTS